MDISIAMCVYNGSRYIGEQLKSIAGQTQLPYELVVCDDGSTDATPHIVRSFATGASFLVRYVRNQRTLGSSSNFERAVRLCRGQAIALCDQDDLWHRDKLKVIAGVFDSEADIGGVFSDGALIDGASQSLPGSLWQRRGFTPRMQAVFNAGNAGLLLRKNVVTGATFAFRSRFVETITPFPTEWVHDAWIALLLAAQSRLCAVPQKLISYRLHAGQQIGVQSAGWTDALRVERANAIMAHYQLAERWYVLNHKLKSLPAESAIHAGARDKLVFLRSRDALRQKNAFKRLTAAPAILPGYCRFSRGLLSLVRDITQAGYSKPEPPHQGQIGSPGAAPRSSGG